MFLIVEDSEDDALLLVETLHEGGFSPAYRRVETEAAYRAVLGEEAASTSSGHAWDVIIADYVLPHFSGLAAIRILQESGIDIPVIMVSGKAGEETAVEAMRAGAQDYLLKGQLSRLAPAISRELHDANVRRERAHAEQERDRLLIEVQHRATELDATLEAIADGVIIFNPTGSILRINATAQRLLEATQTERESTYEDHLAARLTTRPDGTPYDIEETPVRRALFRGETTRGEIMVHHFPERTTWLSVSAAPIRSAEGQILGAIATLTDITELHELQEQERRMLYTVGHDMRAPATLIMGQVELLLETLQSCDIAARIQPRIDELRHALRRMFTMITDLTALMELGEEQLTLNREPVVLTTYVATLLQQHAEALDTFAPAARHT